MSRTPTEIADRNPKRSRRRDTQNLRANNIQRRFRKLRLEARELAEALGALMESNSFYQCNQYTIGAYNALKTLGSGQWYAISRDELGSLQDYDAVDIQEFIGKYHTQLCSLYRNENTLQTSTASTSAESSGDGNTSKA